MEAKELRIGNLVFSTEDNKIGEVFQIDSSGIVFVNKSGNRWQGLKSIQYIQLTEEILLKCSFKKLNMLFINDIIPFVKIVKCVDCFDVLIGNVSYIKLYSLHQLQNLYFALTGKEIKINL